MHEFSLAQGLHAQLLQLAEQHGATAITVVRVEIGTLSGIVTDSFSFGFEVLAQENALTEKAVLEIACVEPIYRCPACNAEHENKLPPAACNRCGRTDLVREGGEDLILTQVEME